MLAPALDDRALDRLQALGDLWAAVDLFHPAIPDGAPWDDAVVAALPGVLAAPDSDALQHVLCELLTCLGDDAARVRRLEGHPPPDPTFWPGGGGDPAGVRAGELGEGVALVRAGDIAPYAGSADGALLVRRLVATAADSRGAVLDLRDCDAFTARVLGRRLGPLLADPLVLPAVRRRTRLGFDADLVTPHLVGPAMVTTSPVELAAGTAVRRLPLACVIGRESAALPLAVALRRDHGASLIWSGDATGIAGPVESLPFTEGVAVDLTLSRFEPVPGPPDVITSPADAIEMARRAVFTAATLPETDGTVTAPTVPGARAASFTTAGTQRPAWLTRVGTGPSAAPAPTTPPAAPDHLPPWPQRVLGLFRLWSAVAYLYPYLGDIAEDWDLLIRDHSSAIVEARTALDYQLAVAEAVTRLRDTHASTESPLIHEHLGSHRPEGVVVEGIEGRALVTQRVSAPDPPAGFGLEVGDEIISVDGVPTPERLRWLARFLPASTPQSLERRTHRRLLDGPADRPATLVVRRGDAELTIQVVRHTTQAPEHRAVRPVLDRLGQGIAFVDLGRLQGENAGDALDLLRESTVGLIDLRTYPRGTGLVIASSCAGQPRAYARTWWREPRLPRTASATAWQPGEAQQLIEHVVRPVGRERVTCPLVVLIDAGCVSQGEHTALALAAAAEATFVGSATTGADGNIVIVDLPGGIDVVMSGIGVSWPDGSPLQRVGVQPDVPVVRSVRGVQEGRDEIFEAGLAVARDLAGQAFSTGQVK